MTLTLTLTLTFMLTLTLTLTYDDNADGNDNLILVQDSLINFSVLQAQVSYKQKKG